MMKMKKSKTSLLLLMTLVLCIIASSMIHADNPIFSQRFTADPSGLEYNGRLYLYCSHDLDGQTGYDMVDFTCISTDDLVNWTDHGEVFKVPNNAVWAGRAYAPQVVYKDDTFYLYFGNGGDSIGVAKSSSPTGPFTDAKGSALITRSMPNCNVQWCFDPSVFIDSDGQAYLYFGGGGPGNARVIQLGSDMISTVGSAITIDAPCFFEAAWMHKYNDKYYFSYSSDFSAGAATIEYMMSDSPTADFTAMSTVLPNPPDNSGNNNHHSIFSFQGDWYIAYHNRKVAIDRGVDPVYQRSVCIDRLNYNSDGAIQQVSITSDGPPQLKNVDPYVQNEAETLNYEHLIETEECSEGGRDVTAIENGDYIRVKGVNFSDGAGSFAARVASDTSGGNIEIRLDSVDGTLVGACPVAGTGGSQTWETRSCTISGASGVHDLYFKFTGDSGNLFKFNWWQFYTVDNPAPSPTPTQSSVVTPAPSVSPDNERSVSYTIEDWGGGGATVSITIRNNGTIGLYGWELSFSFPGNQTITNLWNGGYTQDGNVVTVSNETWNAIIPAGGTVNFGFNLSFSGTNAKPTDFTLNGAACSVR
jgi:arabinoxylan arabinofuranohydrolase